MKTAERYSVEERSTYSHAFKITFADLTAAATTQTLTLIPGIIIGDLIDKASFFLKTPFSGGAGTNLTIQLGYTGTAAGLIAAAELNVAATEILAGDATGSDFATLRTGKAFVATSAVEALFTATGANLSTLTAGEVHVFVNVIRLSKAGGF